jgi:hypothetical protein
MNTQNINDIDDLFLYPELIPEQVQNILDTRNFDLNGYTELERINNELRKIGYEFDYGLDAEPYYLTKIKN